MDRPYGDFLREFSDVLERAERLPRGAARPAPRPAPKAGAPKALILAPHPDDECIVGALPLRLQREEGWSVAVVPVTLGSRAERRAERLAELKAACAYLGWEALPPADGGIASVVKAQAPALVLYPHADDANTTHREVHRACASALTELGAGWRGLVAETEYWATLPDPNLMLEASSETAADLVTALSFHKGEIERNPYHVLLPCWLADGARRGAELVGGQGSAAPGFRYAALYRLSDWDGRTLKRRPAAVCAAGSGLATLLKPAA